MDEIDPHNLPFATWSFAHQVGVIIIVSLQTFLPRFGFFASHRLNVARWASSGSRS